MDGQGRREGDAVALEAGRGEGWGHCSGPAPLVTLSGSYSLTEQ